LRPCRKTALPGQTGTPGAAAPRDPDARAAELAAIEGGSSAGRAQSYVVSVPHGSAVLAMGTSAAPVGASLTTVGSILIDAKGTLGLQSKADFTAQTNAAMALLSAKKTQAHTQAKMEIYAGGGVAPGACGAGTKAASPKTTTPAEMQEKMVTAAISAAALAKNAYEVNNIVASGGAGSLAHGAEVLDAMKNVAYGTANDAAGGQFEMMSGAMGAMSGGGIAGVAGGLAAGAGGAVAVANGTDVEHRSTRDIKMVAGCKMSSSALAGFDYKVLNRLTVTAALVTDFTTIQWYAFCLLKWEVKAMSTVKCATTTLSMKAKTTGKIEGMVTLDFKAPNIKQDGDVTVTKTLKVEGETFLNSKLNVNKATTLHTKLTAEKNATLKNVMHVDGATELAKKLRTTKKNQFQKDFLQMAKAQLA
jgi:hypothetical protein